MTTRVPEAVQQMKPETVSAMQELSHAMHDNIEYLNQAAQSIDDRKIAQVFDQLASQRQQMNETLSEFMSLADSPPEHEGSFLGSLRKIWTEMRAGLNGGDATVVLIEAERAEDAIVNKFKDILPEIAGNPLNDKLLAFFEEIKHGHDRIRDLRDTYKKA